MTRRTTKARPAREDPNPDEISQFQDLAGFYAVFADPTRLRILKLLMDRECCVHEIAAHLRMQQSAVSHQLRVLRQAHLVRARRVAREAVYSLSDDHVRSIYEQGLVHVGEGR